MDKESFTNLITTVMSRIAGKPLDASLERDLNENRMSPTAIRAIDCQGMKRSVDLSR